MAFPTVGPTGFAWLEELQEVPSLLLNDKALIVSVAKIAGLLPLSVGNAVRRGGQHHDLGDRARWPTA